MSAIGQVYRKEAQEMLRDKRVRNAAVVMPLVVILMMMSVFGIIFSAVGGKSKQKIEVVQTSDPLLPKIAKDPKLDIHTIPDEATGVKMIQDGKSRLVVELAPKGSQDTITFLYDPKEDGAQIAKATFQGALGPVLKAEAAKVLAAYNLSPDQAEPIKFVDHPVNVGEGPGASGIVVSLLPYLIVLFAFTGGFALASDIVAGEKERNTLETLLISPVHRTHIVLGKFFALCTVCFLSSASALLGLALASVMKLPGSETMFKTGLGLTPKAGFVILLIMLPLVALFASVLLAVSTYARNTREAQTYLGFVNILVIFPAVFSQVIGLTGWAQQLWINAVPILGTANNIRSALLGKAAIGPTAISIAVSSAIAAVALYYAIGLFRRESVLVRI